MSNMIKFHPIISCIQKIALYETKSNFYLVGSNNTQNRFKVIKIDRMQPKELHIHDDKVEYTAHEIQNLVNMIHAGNRQRTTGNGASKVVSAFGIVGFIKFLEGYYVILITKRRKVAVVGMHSIYKIEDTHMIYIPHESVRETHPEELRYFKMFQNIDLASNFYFSYSYDLTHSLQHNLAVPKQFLSNKADCNPEFKLPNDIKNFFHASLIQPTSETQHFGIRTLPNWKFVWNNHLLKESKLELHPDWLLYIMHGFVGQSNISIFGRAIYITLIARRSCRYAGTRFLKRGANCRGDVANEVETEQMVYDSGVSSFTEGHYTSFVQMRGSIPGHWKQDMGKMVAKPAITIDLNDPYAETAGAHFNELFKRYGTPIYVLNLVKQRERKPQESILSEILSDAIKYLNQFLPVEHQIIYKTFDMARKSKGTANVMQNLADIAKTAVAKIGFFHNHRKYYAQKPNTVVGQFHNELLSLQTGIIRTNCVDCLDRTNTAQFAIGKCVLGYQLCALGALDSSTLEFDTDCVRMLECLYEDHGDTLALQYGGSQLVHRIKTYRKTAPWTSQGNDIMQTLSRYYSNTFSDAEKQNTINLFLGLYVPEETGRHIWELTTDHYLHHKVTYDPNRSLTRWWNPDVVKCLPLAYDNLTKSCYEIIQVPSRDVEMIDAYDDFHRPHELGNLSDVFSFTINHSVRDFMPNFTTDCSPFSIRVRPVRRREESKGSSMKNPSVTGQSSTSSTGSTCSSTSSSAEESCFDDDSSHYYDTLNTKISDTKMVTFKNLFPTMKEVYGTELKPPNDDDLLIYKKYAYVAKTSTKVKPFSSVLSVMRIPEFSKDASISVKPPKVDKKSIEIYGKYINSGLKGANSPSMVDLNIYSKYASLK